MLEVTQKPTWTLTVVDPDTQEESASRPYTIRPLVGRAAREFLPGFIEQVTYWISTEQGQEAVVAFSKLTETDMDADGYGDILALIHSLAEMSGPIVTLVEDSLPMLTSIKAEELLVQGEVIEVWAMAFEAIKYHVKKSYSPQLQAALGKLSNATTAVANDLDEGENSQPSSATTAASA